MHYSSCSKSALVAATACLLLAVAFALLFVPVMSVRQEVDINSGRVRATRYLVTYPLNSRIEDTWLSRGCDYKPGPPEWHVVSVARAGSSSHYQYHSAIAQIDALERLNELVDFDQSARARICTDVLRLWQEGSDDAADQYIERLSTFVLSRNKEGMEAFSAKDLP